MMKSHPSSFDEDEGSSAIPHPRDIVLRGEDTGAEAKRMWKRKRPSWISCLEE